MIRRRIILDEQFLDYVDLNVIVAAASSVRLVPVYGIPSRLREIAKMFERGDFRLLQIL